MYSVVHPPGVKVLVVLTDRCITLQKSQCRWRGAAHRTAASLHQVILVQATSCGVQTSGEKWIATFFVELYRPLHISLTWPMINSMAQLQEVRKLRKTEHCKSR